MTTLHPSGRVEKRAGEHVLVLTREFSAPIEDVWAAVTESDRLARWIGRWQGDPASGAVRFDMGFEEGHPGEEMEIRRCDPPTALHVTAHPGDDVWLLDVDLTSSGGVTTLTLTQHSVAAEQAESVGPGWEYYLDRMVDAESGADPERRDFDRDYYPAMAAHFRGQFG